MNPIDMSGDTADAFATIIPGEIIIHFGEFEEWIFRAEEFFSFKKQMRNKARVALIELHRKFDEFHEIPPRLNFLDADIHEQTPFWI
jgi:hypothetical protein